MTESHAKTLILASVGTSAVLASLDSISRGQRPDLRIFVGAGVTGFLLLVGAEVSPQLAGGFALLLLVGALLTNGVKAAGAVTKSLT